MDIHPLTGSLGAEIIGADIKDDQQFKAIYQAFVDHSVITIRGQDIGPEDHLAFARRFGSINVNRFFKKLDTHPEIAIVLKEKDQKRRLVNVGTRIIPMIRCLQWDQFYMRLRFLPLVGIRCLCLWHVCLKICPTL